MRGAADRGARPLPLQSETHRCQWPQVHSLGMLSSPEKNPSLSCLESTSRTISWNEAMKGGRKSYLGVCPPLLLSPSVWGPFGFVSPQNESFISSWVGEGCCSAL